MEPVTRNIIAEIGDGDFYPDFVPPKNLDGYHVRKASRGMLIYQGQLALLYVSQDKYHKLPGGGIGPGETHEQAFIREVREETGCDCKITDDQGQNLVVLETRDKFKLLQISYIFFSEVVGKPRELHLTPDEIKAGFQLQWVPVNQAYELLLEDQPASYEGKFIQKRDLAVMLFYGYKFPSHLSHSTNSSLLRS